MPGVADISALFKVPGRLCVNPASFSGTYPYGGTDLGLLREIRLRVQNFTEDVSEEGLGVKVVWGKLDMGELWHIAAIVRAPDQGQLHRLFGASKTGAVSGRTIVVSPGASLSPVVRVGAWLPTVKLLFAPNDVTQWHVYFPAATADLEEEAELALSLAKDFDAPAVYTAMPPAGGLLESVQFGPIEDLVF